MTLVLAVRFRDGVVLASDGQATTEASGQPTRQAVRKLFAVGGRIAWGAAGAVGLQQALGAALAGQRRALAAAADPRPLLVETATAVQRRGVREFVALPGAHPPELAGVFCWWDGAAGRPAILSVPRTGSDHQLHDRWAAVGSGDIFADFAMATVAHLRMHEQGAGIAKLVAFAAIADAIGVAAVFLGPPIQMAVVTRDGGAWKVPRRELEHALPEALEAWRARQRATLGIAEPAPPSLIGTMRAMRAASR